ncbi:intracellular protein transporter USO1-like protein [Rhynchospora pubera]|uniref:Intracellular protein transporter USO1-like protein n=1 Tax=Rhynchospora pubera TaxID=906938 RepID=A0AAV8D5S8_9POAL|nr:intracellular protein transporter USO1-like protein [Rhynchospora pubera]
MRNTGRVQLKKRGLSSSSATSSSRTKIKLKRPLLIHRRGGTTTPVPMLKTRGGSRSSCADAPGISQNYRSPEVLDGIEGSISARKLVSVLWQLNNDIKNRDLSEYSRNSASSISSYYKTKRHRKKALENDRSKNNSSWYREERSISSHCNLPNAMQIQACNHLSPQNSVRESRNHRLRHLNNSIAASREILKALIRLMGPENLQSSKLSLLSALHSELDRAHVHLNRLEEKETLRKREKEKILHGFEMVIEELNIEKKARKKAEKVNKRLEMALIQMEKTVLEATDELERERRSRERVERVCKELVRGIGEDRTQVEELKRQAIELQEELEREREILQVELEKEREMLQIADEWREERVQMKLSEARCQFEEKNMAVDELRNELEAYLVSKKHQDSNIATEDQFKIANEIFHEESVQLKFQEKGINQSRNEMGYSSPEKDDEIDIQGEHKGENENMCIEAGIIEFNEKNKAIDQLRNELEIYLNAKTQQGEICNEGEFDDEDKLLHTREIDSGDDSDLQSIELDMENGMQWDFEKMGAEGAVLLDRESERMYQNDVERYNLVKGLRDNMLAGSGFIVDQDKACYDSFEN